MLTYDKAMKNPSVLRSLTGFDRSEFEKMLPPFEKAWRGYVEENYIRDKHRKRKFGGGRKPKLLTVENRLFFILFYFFQNLSASDGDCLFFRYESESGK